MSIDFASPSSPGNLRLEDFAHAARSGGDVYVSADGQAWQVLGQGQTPGGRSVAWVAPDVDTASMFARALADSYGNGIASAVSRELGLDPSPGRPLSARTVSMALDMAQTASMAMEGVDFATRLACSALGGSPAFAAACRQAGVQDPAAVGPALRGEIDAAMQARFETAAAGGQSPVPLSTAQAWLNDITASKLAGSNQG
ncbi:hypothetical protein V8Z80_13125 [Orrella sp. JC864]|uniref:hypothetical protein n=1 Tax=Orrella sp. JC864 TaxID=3120298 RepID=UPI00300BF846